MKQSEVVSIVYLNGEIHGIFSSEKASLFVEQQKRLSRANGKDPGVWKISGQYIIDLGFWEKHV